MYWDFYIQYTTPYVTFLNRQSQFVNYAQTKNEQLLN